MTRLFLTYEDGVLGPQPSWTELSVVSLLGMSRVEPSPLVSRDIFGTPRMVYGFSLWLAAYLFLLISQVNYSLYLEVRRIIKRSNASIHL